MLVYFGFTFCPDVCPTTLNHVADALDRLGDKADKIVPVLITVDPKRDTPEAMKQYVAAFTPRMVGLTGTPEQAAAAARAYRVYYKENRTGPGPNDYTMDHSSILYLMGPDGAFIAPLRAEAPGEQIAADLARHVK
jgi:protein SCO1/2